MPVNHRHSYSVLHILNRLSDRGDGISNVCVDLACRQAIDGDQVAIATLPGGYTELVERFGVQLIEFDFRLRNIAGAVGFTRALLRLRQMIRRLDPDIVHAHTLLATVLGRLAVLGTDTRVVATVHNEYQRGVILMAAAHRLVGVSEAVSAAMRRRGVPRRKIRTVLNGVVGSVRRDRTRQVLSSAVRRPAIVAVGSVSERKGSDLLVEVGLRLAESHGAHTYFAGNIDWNEPQRLANRSSAADHIHFLGFQSDPRWLLTGATVFVLASRRDPAPLVLIEALESGLPIVATSVDGVPELLDNGAAGLLTPPEDVDALTAAVRKLLDSEFERARLVRAAVHRSAELAVERVCADYRSVYGELARSAELPDWETSHE